MIGRKASKARKKLLQVSILVLSISCAEPNEEALLSEEEGLIDLTKSSDVEKSAISSFENSSLEFNEDQKFKNIPTSIKELDPNKINSQDVVSIPKAPKLDTEEKKIASISPKDELTRGVSNSGTSKNQEQERVEQVPKSVKPLDSLHQTQDPSTNSFKMKVSMNQSDCSKDQEGVLIYNPIKNKIHYCKSGRITALPKQFSKALKEFVPKNAYQFASRKRVNRSGKKSGSYYCRAHRVNGSKSFRCSRSLTQPKFAH